MEKGARLPVWPDSQSDMYAGKLLKHWWSEYSITIALRNQHLFITNIKTKNVSIAGWSVKTFFSFLSPWGCSRSPHTRGRGLRLCPPWPPGRLCVSLTRLRTRPHWCPCSTSTASAGSHWQIPEAQKHRLFASTETGGTALYIHVTVCTNSRAMRRQNAAAKTQQYK